jgi:hypothetical protein
MVGLNMVLSLEYNFMLLCIQRSPNNNTLSSVCFTLFSCVHLAIIYLLLVRPIRPLTPLHFPPMSDVLYQYASFNTVAEVISIVI